MAQTNIVEDGLPAIVTCPCEKRRDGAASVGMVQTKIVKGGFPPGGRDPLKPKDGLNGPPAV